MHYLPHLGGSCIRLRCIRQTSGICSVPTWRWCIKGTSLRSRRPKEISCTFSSPFGNFYWWCARLLFRISIVYLRNTSRWWRWWRCRASFCRTFRAYKQWERMILQNVIYFGQVLTGLTCSGQIVIKCRVLRVLGGWDKRAFYVMLPPKTQLSKNVFQSCQMP